MSLQNRGQITLLQGAKVSIGHSALVQLQNYLGKGHKFPASDTENSLRPHCMPKKAATSVKFSINMDSHI